MCVYASLPGGKVRLRVRACGSPPRRLSLLCTKRSNTCPRGVGGGEGRQSPSPGPGPEQVAEAVTTGVGRGTAGLAVAGRTPSGLRAKAARSVASSGAECSAPRRIQASGRPPPPGLGLQPRQPQSRVLIHQRGGQRKRPLPVRLRVAETSSPPARWAGARLRPPPTPPETPVSLPPAVSALPFLWEFHRSVLNPTARKHGDAPDTDRAAARPPQHLRPALWAAYHPRCRLTTHTPNGLHARNPTHSSRQEGPCSARVPFSRRFYQKTKRRAMLRGSSSRLGLITPVVGPLTATSHKDVGGSSPRPPPLRDPEPTL